MPAQLFAAAGEPRDRAVISLDQKGLSPEQLAEQCQAGCREAFALLLEQYEKRIFNYLYQMTRNCHDAEDLTQETFLKAYRGIHRFDATNSFTAWLFTIAKRTAINHFRSAKRGENREVEPEVDHEDPSRQLERDEAANSLWQLAKTLKASQYDALWLRYGEDLSIAETARVMNTNPLRVRVLLHRARANLAKRLRRDKAN